MASVPNPEYQTDILSSSQIDTYVDDHWLDICIRDIFFSFVNIQYFVVHIVCEVDVIANSLVLYLQFFSTLNNFFFFFFFYNNCV